MNYFNYLSKAALSLGLLISINAAAEKGFSHSEGGDNSGGGNSINHALIEDYSVTPSELPDFDEVEKYLKIFDERTPQFAKNLREVVNFTADSEFATVWYLIPKKITQLPVNKTGLHFSSTQVALQVGDEIFFNQKDLMALTKAARGRLYLHEILMMSRANDDKDAQKVRKLMNFLKVTKYAPTAEDLIKVLDDLDFCLKNRPSRGYQTKVCE
jgi:hypothetical protein